MADFLAGGLLLRDSTKGKNNVPQLAPQAETPWMKEPRARVRPDPVAAQRRREERVAAASAGYQAQGLGVAGTKGALGV